MAILWLYLFTSILCLISRSTVTSARIMKGTLVTVRATFVLCLFSCVQKGTLGLTHKRCVQQRISLGALSDVTVVLGMRQSIVVLEYVQHTIACFQWGLGDSYTYTVNEENGKLLINLTIVFIKPSQHYTFYSPPNLLSDLHLPFLLLCKALWVQLKKLLLQYHFLHNYSVLIKQLLLHLKSILIHQIIQRFNTCCNIEILSIDIIMLP